MDKEFQQLGCESAYYAYHEGERDEESPLPDMLLSPKHYLEP